VQDFPQMIESGIFHASNMRCEAIFFNENKKIRKSFKISTGEFPVFFGLVPALIRVGVRVLAFYIGPENSHPYPT
jgi:hypothetical protein